MDPKSEPDDDVDTKERYEATLRTVALQTSPVQLPGATLATVKVVLAANGRYSGEGIERSVQAATQNGDLVKWTDADGNTRYTLKTESDLQRAAKYCGERALEDAVATLNTALAEVRD